MSGWQNSNRRDRLPPDWHQIRRRIFKRDRGRCQWRLIDGEKCGSAATDVDHIKHGDDHRDANLQLLCKYHHGIKSGGEGGRASAGKRAEIRSRFRRVEKHPGLL